MNGFSYKNARFSLSVTEISFAREDRNALLSPAILTPTIAIFSIIHSLGASAGSSTRL